MSVPTAIRARAQRRAHRRCSRTLEPRDERHGGDQDRQPAHHRLRAFAPHTDDLGSKGTSDDNSYRLSVRLTIAAAWRRRGTTTGSVALPVPSNGSEAGERKSGRLDLRKLSGRCFGSDVRTSAWRPTRPCAARRERSQAAVDAGRLEPDRSLSTLAAASPSRQGPCDGGPGHRGSRKLHQSGARPQSRSSHAAQPRRRSSQAACAGSSSR